MYTREDEHTGTTGRCAGIRERAGALQHDDPVGNAQKVFGLDLDQFTRICLESVAQGLVVMATGNEVAAARTAAIFPRTTGISLVEMRTWAA